MINFKILIILLIILFYEINYNILNPNKINCNNLPSFPIDIVYTWAGEKNTDNIRTSNNNELKYSIKSVLKYLPWINHIYILMNPPKKKPIWITPEMNKIITFIDQTETFPIKYKLPNTNSNAIETTIINIPNLNEHFIYFNDDTFIGQYLPYTYFFSEDGKAMVSHKCVNTKNMVRKNKKNILNIKLPEMGYKFYPHVPIPLIKSLIYQYHLEYPEYIDWIRNTQSRYKTGCDVCKQFNLYCPCQLQHYIIGNYMYKKGKAILKDYNLQSVCSINGYVNSTCLELLDEILIKPPPTFTIQDTEEDPNKREIFKEKINNFFNNFYK